MAFSILRVMEDPYRLLIFKMNALIGQNSITFIEFRIDPGHVAAVLPTERPRDVTLPKLDDDLVAAAAGIKDEQLRDLFLRTASLAIHNNQANAKE